jgi:hypothetical protein
MAKEIAQTGCPQIRRPDRDDLLAIKTGRFAYEDFMAKASAERKKVDESFALSSLPGEPDVQQIERWAVEIRKAWYLSGEV